MSGATTHKLERGIERWCPTTSNHEILDGSTHSGASLPSATNLNAAARLVRCICCTRCHCASQQRREALYWHAVVPVPHHSHNISSCSLADSHHYRASSLCRSRQRRQHHVNTPFQGLLHWLEPDLLKDDRHKIALECNCLDNIKNEMSPTDPWALRNASITDETVIACAAPSKYQ